MTISPEELAKFERLGAAWRDPMGPMRVLHVINPLRLRWLTKLAERAHAAGSLAKLEVLDVGCAAGLLSEALANRGAHVTGIDPVERNIRLAESAAARSGQQIEYRVGTAEGMRGVGRRFDLVCAFEVIEHVPDRLGFLRTLSAVVRPGGLLAVSSIDRTILSFLVAIVGAESICRLLPRGTHRWEWFVRPEEAEAVLACEGLRQIDRRGLWYWPVLNRALWTRSTRVNWFGAWRREP